MMRLICQGADKFLNRKLKIILIISKAPYRYLAWKRSIQRHGTILPQEQNKILVLTIQNFLIYKT